MKDKSITELEQLILSSKASIARKAMKDRKFILNKELCFNDITIRHFLTFNDVLFAQMHGLYQNVLQIKNDLDQLIMQGGKVYENYSVLAELYLQASDEFHENHPILGKVIEESRINWCISAICNETLDSREDCCMEDINWNIEQLSFFKEYNHYICYAAHSLFVDDDSLALVDILYLKHEMIQSNIKIYL